MNNGNIVPNFYEKKRLYIHHILHMHVIWKYKTSWNMTSFLKEALMKMHLLLLLQLPLKDSVAELHLVLKANIFNAFF